MTMRRFCILWIVLCQLGWGATAYAQDLTVNWYPEFSPERPGEVEVEGPIPLGDGRYRMEFSASAPATSELVVHYQVVNGLNVVDGVVMPVTASLNIVGNPNFPAPILGSGSTGSIGPVTVDTGDVLDLELSVSQALPERAPATFLGDREYTVPGINTAVQYFADVGDDGHYELSGGGDTFEFDASPGQNIELVGHATAGGLDRHFQTVFDIVNRAPTLSHVAVNLPTNGTRQLILLAEASDLDKDTLRYRVRWGDGAEDFFTDSLLVHTYAADGPFNVEITVFDYLDAQDSMILPFSFPAFSDQSPVVGGVSELGRNGFERTFLVDAYDPEGTALTYRVDWGDGSGEEVFSTPVLVHEFPAQRPATYSVSVWSIDALGNETRHPFDVAFAAEPVNLSPTITGVHLLDKTHGRIVIAVEASDPEGGAIQTSVEWGDGSSEPVQNAAFFSHDYAVFIDQVYTVNVLVSDVEGNVTDAALVVTFDPIANASPNNLTVVEVARDGFTWVGAIHADDPDGDDLVYTVDFRDGTDPIVTSSGLVRHTFPQGLFQTYPLTITAVDSLGGQVSGTHQVAFAAPDINQSPLILGVTELIRDERDVVVKVDVQDPEMDEISLEFDWGDGFVTPDQTTFIAAHAYGMESNAYTLRIVATDSNGNQATFEHDVVFEPPLPNQPPVFVDTREISRNEGEVLLLAQALDPEGDALRYRWRFDEGSPDVQTETPLLAHQFPADVLGVYTVSVRATDLQGAFVDTTLQVTIEPPPPNQAPVIRSVHVIETTQYEVIVFVDAFDPEHDELLYAFDWGDGTLPFETAAPFAAYTYAENVFRDYPLSVTVFDGLEQSTEFESTVRIIQPAPNEPPEVEDVEIVISPRGLVDLRVAASDPERDNFDIIVDWGDGVETDETPVLRSGQGRHRYAYRADRTPYEGLLTLTDVNGAETLSNFSITIPDAPTEIHQTDTVLIGDGLVYVSIFATDLDSPQQLLHSFDFDGDFVFEQPSRLSGDAFHQFSEPGRHQVNLLLTDPWSGQTTAHTIGIDVPSWRQTPTVPSFERVIWSAEPSGHVRLVVEMLDPDDQLAELEVSWGDVSEDGGVDRIVNGVARHRYAYRIEPYLGRVTGRTAAGIEITHNFEIRVSDLPTSFGHVTTTNLGQGRVFLSASAFDADSSLGLNYLVDVNADGTAEVTGFGSVAEVLSFEQAGSVLCRVAVQDSWSGTWSEQLVQLVVEPWIGRAQPPIIESVQVQQSATGHVRLLYDVADVDDTEISMFVHWGDEPDSLQVESVGSLEASHQYTSPRFGRAYYGFLEAVNEDGLKSIAPFTVELEDAPTLITSLSSEVIDRSTWRLHVTASDGDSNDLIFGFDLFDDGDIEETGSTDPSYFFAEEGEDEVPLRVYVTDPWSGITIDERFVVRADTENKNLGPEIIDLSAQIMPGGMVQLTVDARDVNDDRLTLNIDWGDGETSVVSGQVLPMVAHRYARPQQGYLVTATVSDGSESADEKTLFIDIVDALAIDTQLDVVNLGEGWVMFMAFAYDPDGVSLYAFDADADGTFERSDSPVSSWTHRYENSGQYTARLRVTDPWSGASDVLERFVDVQPWTQPVPIVDDHIAVTEGSCLKLQTNDNQITANTVSDGCGAVESDTREIQWDMGDGTMLTGSAVNHRYADEGTYLVKVIRHLSELQTQESAIAVMVQNAAPSFGSGGFPLATAGEVYESHFIVSDPGVEDLLEVDIVDGPTDMSIVQSDDESWHLTWAVPLNSAGPVEVELRVRDGQSVDESFIYDGGEDRLRFTLFVRPVELVPPEVEPSPPMVGTLSGGGSGCTVNVTSVPSTFMICLLLGGAMILRRRDL